jgi:hypothetical protein
MNRLLEPETSTPERRRGPRFWQDEEKQSVVVGLVLTFILWWPSLLLFGWALNHIHGKDDGKFTGRSQARQFNIELAPPEVKQPPKPVPNKFVETNPEAPQHIPDQTRNFASRNQQVAQEKPTLNGHNDLAATKGRKDVQSTQVVDGHLSQKKPIPTAPSPAVPPSSAANTPRVREQNPLPGFDKSLGDNKDAFGTEVAKEAENVRNVPQKVEGVKNAPLIEGANPNVPPIDPKHPMPRPQLDSNVRPAIFSDNPNGTSNVGLAANTAFRTNYGEYLDRMSDAVQAGWDNLLNNSDALPPGGTTVAVTFILKSDGTVSQVVKVDGNSSDLGQKYCVSAITDRGSYGKWTADMIAMLGTEQEMTFTFYYF